MIPVTYIIVGIILALTYFIFNRQGNAEFDPKIPTVSGSLPLVGHGFYIYFDEIGFLQRAHKKYGNIFRIKIYRSELIIVCDRAFLAEMTKLDESKLSMYQILIDIYFTPAFVSDYTPVYVDVLRKGIGYKLSEATPLMKTEAINLVKKLMEVDLKKPLQAATQLEVFRGFASRTSGQVFLGLDLNEVTLKALKKFSRLLDISMISTYFIPVWLVHFLAKIPLAKLRNVIRKQIDPTIIKYQQETELDEKMMFRAIADKTHESTGDQLTTEQMSGTVISFLFASSQNTGSCIQMVLIDLAKNPAVYKELQAEVAEHMEKDDMNGILQSSLLHACIMETSRLYSTTFVSFRKWATNAVFRGYNFKNGEVICICQPLVMWDEAVFSNPSKYNPHRFLGKNPDSWSQYKIFTWGAGTHLCPGKLFAIYEVKMAIAFLIHNFKFEVPLKKFQTQYLGTTSFAYKDCEMVVTPR